MSLKYEPEEVPTEETPQLAVRIPSPLPLFTIILIALYTAVSLFQVSIGLDRSVLIAGFVKQAFIHGHEYWRILTGAALHGGLLHLALNSYAFYSFGKIFEMLTNRAHLAIVFLLAAVGGGVLSLVLMPDGISVGASGGIVGLIGYLAVYAFRRRQFISPEFRRSLLFNIGFILIYGLMLHQVIDNYGHIGGLITGAVYGFIQIPADPQVDPREAGKLADVLGLASIGIYAAVCIFAIMLMLSVA